MTCAKKKSMTERFGHNDVIAHKLEFGTVIRRCGSTLDKAGKSHQTVLFYHHNAL
jgi:hypothetical protein